jgi:hypothetical protein
MRNRFAWLWVQSSLGEADALPLDQTAEERGGLVGEPLDRLAGVNGLGGIDTILRLETPSRSSREARAVAVGSRTC